MDINKAEMTLVELTAVEAAASEALVLNELQLALVGGGNATVDFS